MNERRVAITGLGVISPAGCGVEPFWSALIAGRSCLALEPIANGAQPECRLAGVARDFDLGKHFPDRKQTRFMERSSGFAAVAAKLAVADAGLDLAGLDSGRIGVYAGTTGGALQWGYDQLEKARHATVQAAHPHLAVICFLGTLIGSICIPLGINGRSIVISNLDLSGADAIGHGYLAIRRGDCDAALVGGTEAPLLGLVYKGLDDCLSHWRGAPEQASRPFDRRRDGFVLSEGCAMLALEELERAQQRGARIYAEIAGYETVAQGAPADAIRGALDQADARPDDIGYICAQANGMRGGDQAEAESLRAALGSAAEHIPVSSIKSMLGHPLAAAGAMQAVASALAIERDALPPTINLSEPDRGCCLDHILTTRSARVDAVLQDSSSLNGGHSALLYRRVSDCGRAL